MHVFHCDRCGAILPFDAATCGSCDAIIGYVGDDRRLRVLSPTADPAVFRLDGADQLVWHCLNAAWGCNWTVPNEADNTWCRSCQLTRGRPDVGRPDAVAAWVEAEAAKRRLVHQLDGVGLPIVVRSDANPDGLAFDLVHLPGEGGITGHLDGVVTLDLTETDEVHRDDLRRRLGEPFRTVIGHLRHEVGHHYWGYLVQPGDGLDEFHDLFGDPELDYAAAIDQYYATATADWDATRFISSYATSHPHEDWAETWAHYLHITDALDTAVAHDLVPPDSAGLLIGDHVGALEFGEILDAWRPINRAVSAVAATLGTPPPYPFEPSGRVIDKLSFVHRRLRDRPAAHRFADGRRRELRHPSYHHKADGAPPHLATVTAMFEHRRRDDR